MMFEGYFDESGDFDDHPGIFCVAGYFITADDAKIMDEKWGAALNKYGVPYFHMVDCAHGNPPFKDVSIDDRIELVKELIALIKQYTQSGFALLAEAASYDPPPNDAPNIYTYCADGCVSALRMFLEQNRIESSVAYIFEAGHKNRHSAYNHIARKLKRETDSLTFAAKAQVRLLQAADLLAWQSCKYAKDYSFARMRGDSPKRRPRKDFVSLMEHDHTFMYMGPSKAMGIELWPMEKRSLVTAQIVVGDDGPVPYWREDADPTPIFPVDETFGWRMGGGRMAYVGFSGFKQ